LLSVSGLTAAPSDFVVASPIVVVMLDVAARCDTITATTATKKSKPNIATNFHLAVRSFRFFLTHPKRLLRQLPFSPFDENLLKHDRDRTVHGAPRGAGFLDDCLIELGCYAHGQNAIGACLHWCRGLVVGVERRRSLVAVVFENAMLVTP
jgi:hypothetical protein